MICDSSQKIEADRDELSQLHAQMAAMDDSLSRMLSLCRLGALAAEGLHEHTRSSDSIALTYYFTLLRDELDTLQRAFIGEGE